MKNCGNCLNRGGYTSHQFKSSDNPCAYCPIFAGFVPRKKQACAFHAMNPKSVTVEKPEEVNDAIR
jgi:hypothetical protein